MAEYQGVCYIINPISPTYFAHLFLTLDTPDLNFPIKAPHYPRAIFWTAGLVKIWGAKCRQDPLDLENAFTPFINYYRCIRPPRIIR